jgi:hypothetical protein
MLLIQNLVHMMAYDFYLCFINVGFALLLPGFQLCCNPSMPAPVHCVVIYVLPVSAYRTVTNALNGTINLKPQYLWQQLELKLQYYCSFKPYL